jgi:hypothetical protein
MIRCRLFLGLTVSTFPFIPNPHPKHTANFANTLGPTRSSVVRPYFGAKEIEEFFS